MNEPIEIDSARKNMVPNTAEYLEWMKQKHNQRMQAGFLTIMAIAALALIVPFGVWLTRLALG